MNQGNVPGASSSERMRTQRGARARTRQALQDEVRACIRFYDIHGADWTWAVEFILFKGHGGEVADLYRAPWHGKGKFYQ